MTRDEFNYECQIRAIDPNVALENESVRDALLSRDDTAVIAALDNEF